MKYINFKIDVSFILTNQSLRKAYNVYVTGTPSTPIMPGGTPGTPSSKTKVK